MSSDSLFNCLVGSFLSSVSNSLTGISHKVSTDFDCTFSLLCYVGRGGMNSSVLQYYKCVYMHPLLVTLGLVCVLITLVFAARNLWCFKSHFHNWSRHSHHLLHHSKGTQWKGWVMQATWYDIHAPIITLRHCPGLPDPSPSFGLLPPEGLYFSVLHYYKCVYMYPLLVGIVCILITLVFDASNLWCFKSHFRNSDVQLIVSCATSEGSARHMASSLLVCMLCGSQLNPCSS